MEDVNAVKIDVSILTGMVL